MSDAVSPVAGAGATWGCALGAFIDGTAADAIGYGGAITVVAGLTAASGFGWSFDMPRAQMRELPQGADLQLTMPAA